MTDDLDGYCPTCLDYVAHDPDACERENERAQVEHAREEAIGALEGASSFLAIGQPLHLADWDDDTREANRVLLAASMRLSREYRRLG